MSNSTSDALQTEIKTELERFIEDVTDGLMRMIPGACGKTRTQTDLGGFGFTFEAGLDVTFFAAGHPVYGLSPAGGAACFDVVFVRRTAEDKGLLCRIDVRVTTPLTGPVRDVALKDLTASLLDRAARGGFLSPPAVH